MRRITCVCSGVVLCASVLGLGPSQASGSSIIATTYNGLKTGVLDPKGDYGVFALSYQNQIFNNTVTSNLVLGGAAVNRAINVPVGKMVAGFAGGTNGNGFYLKSELSKINDTATITSNTVQYTAYATAYVNNAGLKLTKAQATNNKPAKNPQPGGAVGTAIDPYAVPSGTAYPYAPTVGGSLQLDDVGDTGSATYFAVDSSVFETDLVENFYADNTPLSEALWSLTLSGSGPTTGTSGVNVDFEFNPLALNEITFPSSYLATLGSYINPTQEASLIDLSMDASIETALTYSGGTVTLADGYNPFPNGTTFTAAGSGVEYGDGVEAEVAGVPEPASAALLAGMLGAGLLRRRVKRA